jgi:hypothetical protein
VLTKEDVLKNEWFSVLEQSALKQRLFGSVDREARTPQMVLR